MARGIVRGMNAECLREVYGFALKLDAIFYLRVNIDELITRVLQSGGFDYWVESYGFEIVDASNSVEDVLEYLRGRVERILHAAALKNPLLLRLSSWPRLAGLWQLFGECLSPGHHCAGVPFPTLPVRFVRCPSDRSRNPHA